MVLVLRKARHICSLREKEERQNPSEKGNPSLLFLVGHALQTHLLRNLSGFRPQTSTPGIVCSWAL